MLPSVAGLYLRDHGRWRAITDQQGLTSNDVLTALEDREGVIWVAGSGAGLDRVVGIRDWEAWTTAEGLPDNAIWSTVRDSGGRLWVSTAHGLGIWDHRHHKWLIPNDSHGFASHETRQLEQAADGSIWALSPVDGMVRIDPRTLALQYSPAFNGKKYIFEAVAPDGSIWATTPEKLIRFDAHSADPASDRGAAAADRPGRDLPPRVRAGRGPVGDRALAGHALRRSRLAGVHASGWRGGQVGHQHRGARRQQCLDRIRRRGHDHPSPVGCPRCGACRAARLGLFRGGPGFETPRLAKRHRGTDRRVARRRGA